MSDAKMDTQAPEAPSQKKRPRNENWTVDATEELLTHVRIWLERNSYLNWPEITKRYNASRSERRCHTDAKSRFERMYGSKPPKGTAATRERMQSLCKDAEELIRKAQKASGGFELSDGPSAEQKAADINIHDDLMVSNRNADSLENDDVMDDDTGGSFAVSASAQSSEPQLVEYDSDSDQTHISITTSELQRIPRSAAASPSSSDPQVRATKNMFRQASKATIVDSVVSRRAKVDEAVANMANQQKEQTEILKKSVESQSAAMERFSIDRQNQFAARLEHERVIEEQRLVIEEKRTVNEERRIVNEEKRIVIEEKRVEIQSQAVSETANVMRELIQTQQQMFISMMSFMKPAQNN